VADVTINSDGLATEYFAGGLRACSHYLVKDRYTQYLFYIDVSNDLLYRDSTDGGRNWNAGTSVRAGTITSMAAWADWNTQGDDGEIIHVVYHDTDGTDTVFYRQLDTRTNTLGTEITLSSSMTFGVTNDLHWSVVGKTRGGNIVVTVRTESGTTTSEWNHWVSTDGGATFDARSITTLAEADGKDQHLFAQGNFDDPNDYSILYLDDSAIELSRKDYDDSGNSWSETVFSPDPMVSLFSLAYYCPISVAHRESDGVDLVALVTHYDDVSAEVLIWNLNTLQEIVATTPLPTGAEIAFPRITVDQRNDDLYVHLVRGNTLFTDSNVTRYKSSDGGDTWGSATDVNVTDDDFKLLCVPPSIPRRRGGRIQSEWFNDDLSDEVTNWDNSLEAASAGLVVYKGLTVLEDPDNPGSILTDPCGDGGNALQDNFVKLADRVGPVHSSASDPTSQNDGVDTAGLGKTFEVWSMWRHTGRNQMFICLDNTTNAASWHLVIGPGSSTSANSAAIAADTGGNARGNYANDFQSQRSVATDVASGTYSVLLGTYNRIAGDYSFGSGSGNDINNTASDYSSFLGYANNINGACKYSHAWGSNNYINAAYSAFCFGYYHSTSHARTFLFGRNHTSGGTDSVITGTYGTGRAGGFTLAGGASSVTRQTSVFGLRVQTTTSTPADLLTAAGGTGIAIPSNQTWVFVVHVLGRRTDSSETGAYRIEGLIENEAGTTALVGSLTKSIIHEDATAWDATVTANNTTDTLQVNVTGEDSKTIKWTARVEIVEASN